MIAKKTAGKEIRWLSPNLLLLCRLNEIGVDERIEVAVQNRVRVAGLVVRPHVLDHAVRVQDV